MNRTFRVVLNRVNDTPTAVSECTKARGKGKSAGRLARAAVCTAAALLGGAALSSHAVMYTDTRGVDAFEDTGISTNEALAAVSGRQRSVVLDETKLTGNIMVLSLHQTEDLQAENFSTDFRLTASGTTAGTDADAAAYFVGNVPGLGTGSVTMTGTSTSIGAQLEVQQAAENSALTITALYANRNTVTLSADSTVIAAKATVADVNAAVKAFGVVVQSDKVEFTGEKSEISATGAGASASAVFLGSGSVNFRGEKSAITAATDSAKALAAGIELDAYQRDSAVTSGETTGLTVAATSTAAESAGSLLQTKTGTAGIYAVGGSLSLSGTTRVTAEAAAGDAYGLLLAAYQAQMPHDRPFDNTYTFGNLTANAASQGAAYGLAVADSLTSMGMDLKGATAKVTVNGTLSIEASGAAGTGIIFYGSALNDRTSESSEGDLEPALTLKGDTTVTATRALASAWVTATLEDGITAVQSTKNKVGVVNIESGTTVLNGNVDEFTGWFKVKGGSVTVNTGNGKFFGGRTLVESGELVTNAVFDSTGNADEKESIPFLKLKSSEAKVTLAGLTVGDSRTDTTIGELHYDYWVHTKIYDGTLTVNGNLTVAEGGYLGANGGSLIVKNGVSAIKGLLTTTYEDELATSTSKGDRPETSTLALTVDGGSMSVGSAAQMNLGSITATGADLSVKGKIHAGELTLQDGAKYLAESGSVNHFASLKLKNDSAYYAEDKSADGTLTLEGTTLEFAGGNFYRLKDNVKTTQTFTGLVLAERADRNCQGLDALYGYHSSENAVTFSAGDYAFESVAVQEGSLTVSGGTLSVGALSLAAGTNLTVTGGVLSASAFTSESAVAVSGGTFATTTDQLFTTAAGGDAESAGAMKTTAGTISVTGSGKLSFADKEFSLAYVRSVQDLLGLDRSAVEFTGTITDTEIGVDDLMAGDNFPGTVLTLEGSDTAAINKGVTVQSLRLAAGVTDVTTNQDLGLAGSADGGELMAGTGAGAEGARLFVRDGSTLSLGTSAGNTAGEISGSVRLAGGSNLTVKGGSFSVADVWVYRESTIANKGGKPLEIGTLSLPQNSVTTITGAVTVKGFEEVSLDALSASPAVIRIGTNSANAGEENAAGALTVKGNTLSGLTFFLDPAWEDGSEITGASSLIYSGTTVDGNLVVGQNSYVVLGTDSADGLTDLFSNGTLTWGSDAVTAAVYVGSPVTVSTGSLTVDGSLTSVPTTAASGSVTFAANSVLAVSSTAASGTAAITATTFTVDASAVAVVVGDIDTAQRYTLLSDGSATVAWSGTVKAANTKYGLVDNGDGTYAFELQDASEVYGKLMQGTALANVSDSYVDGLLSDATGSRSLADIAARFDAAMNPAGALTVYTTAFDRAREVRQVLREEAGTVREDRLWVRVTGNRTKLSGISTGAQSLNTKTKAYGLIVGGEVNVSDVTLGAAFNAGRGDTKNNRVSAKDDFDYYGFSVYAKTEAAGVDFTGDISYSWVKSDLTVGDGADTKADAKTKVFSIGVEAAKRFNVSGVDVVPFVGVNVYRVDADGYATNHGVRVEGTDATAVEIPVGVHLQRAFETENVKARPFAEFAVVPTVGDRDIKTNVRFSDAVSSYRFTFSDDWKVRAKVGAEVDMKRFTFGAHAGYEWGNEERSSVNVQLRAKYRF